MLGIVVRRRGLGGNQEERRGKKVRGLVCSLLV